MKTLQMTSILIVALLLGCESSIELDQISVRNDGLFYERGADKPFTGKAVDRYAGGALRSSMNFVDGIRTGTQTSWYESGQKLEEATTVGGKPGDWVSWYENGQMKSRTTYGNGQIQEEQNWDENGVETTMRAEINAALELSAGAKAAVAMHVMEQDGLPADNATAGIEEASQITNQYVSAVAIENGVISISIGGDAADDLSGHVLILTPSPDRGSVSWQCSSPDIDSATLPEICR